MALVKPLVLVNGQIQQIQAGDTLNAAVAEQEILTLTNSDAAASVLGELFYIFGAGAVKKAKSDAAGTARGAVIAKATIASAATGSFQSSGIIAGLSGLTVGSVYYASAATAGAITATAPSTVGQYVQEIGQALSTTDLLFNPKAPILL